MNLRDLILAQSDLPKKALVIPEWKDGEGKPVTIYVRTMTAGDRDAIEKAKLSNPDFKMRATITSIVVVDSDGNRVFKDSDIDSLDKMSGAAIDRIVVALGELNNIDVESLEKN